MTYKEALMFEKETGLGICLCPVCGDWAIEFVNCGTCGYESSGKGFDDDLDFHDIDHHFSLREYRQWYKEGTLRKHIAEVQPNWQDLIDSNALPDKPGKLVDFPLVYPEDYDYRFDN